MTHHISFKIKECEDCYIGKVMISAIDFYSRRGPSNPLSMDKIPLIKFKVCILKNNDFDRIFKVIQDSGLSLIIRDNDIIIGYYCNPDRLSYADKKKISRLNFYFKDIEYYYNNIRAIKGFNFNYAFKIGQYVFPEILDRKSLSWIMHSYNSHHDLKKILILINQKRRINEDEAK